MPGICHRCEKTVYFNEERMAIGKSFHKTCFVCANKGCGRRLDSGNLTEHSGDVYCRSCYGKLFGPKGYGYGVGAGVLATDATTITTKVVNEPSIKKIGETVVVKPSLSVSSSISSSASPSPVNSVSSTPSPQPPSPTEASSGSTPVSSGTCSPTSDEAISLESDKRESPSPSESISSSSTTANVTPKAASITTISTPNSISAEINNKGSVAKMINNNNSINSIANGIAAKLKFGGAEMCPRCNKAVYMAERMMGGGSAWHKTSCFNCKECHKRLESTTLCEKDHEIYCKTCYRKNWGPKGYGYGVTALQSCK